MRAPTWLTEQRLERGAWIGTGLFVLTATAAAVVPSAFETAALAVSIVLFLVGCWAFLLAFFVGVERSRVEEISVVGLYFLSGSAPGDVRRSLLGATALQTIVALVTASVRPFTSLAFGILVPMFGLGLAGLWAAAFGTFPERVRRDPRSRGRSPQGPGGDGHGQPPNQQSRSKRDG